jgi:hypothetical protein
MTPVSQFFSERRQPARQIAGNTVEVPSMNATALKATGSPLSLIKTDPNSPALIVTGLDAISVKAGTIFRGRTFDTDTPVVIDVALEPGTDYAVTIKDGALGYARLDAAPTGDDVLGGFHFAPGGNATARAGGDTTPAINPFSVWDLNFRPSCPDPRGMVLVGGPGRRFWVDIYLTGANHLADGTSKFGVTIADGNDRPQMSDGKKASAFDYPTAVAVMALHGKQLLSINERFAAAFGVTERTSAEKDPKITRLDALRTSKFGLMQAAGSMWEWGHDGDPDEPRPCLFGGSWWDDSSSGSRRALVGRWPDDSVEYLGARGRSDHLQPA